MTLPEFAIAWTTAMYALDPERPEDVTRMISTYPANLEDLELIRYCKKFKLSIKAYLHGKGHPDMAFIRDVVGEAFERDRENPILRATTFLRTMTATSYVPVRGTLSVRYQLAFYKS